MTESAQQLLRGAQKRDSLTQEVVQDGMKGTDPQVIRESDRLLILNYVREHGPVARVTIARATGLSATTVSTIIDTLLQEGFVSEGAMQRSGQRVVPVHFNAIGGYILGIALGRRHLTMLLCDLNASVASRSILPFDAAQGAEICLPLLTTAFLTFVREQGISWSRIVGIGLGMPGPIDSQLQGPVTPPRMPGWHNVNVRDLLSYELGVPVYLDNNANLGALGESRYGAGQRAGDMIYLQLGAGIGGGLIVGGKIYRGSAGSAGEIGHMTIEPRGPLCCCGKHGCLEVLAGARAIVAEARRRGARYLVDESTNELEPAPDSSSEITDIGQVARAAQAGNLACRAALEYAGMCIGIALANLMNILNPSLILLDGSSMQAGTLLLEPIRHSIATYSHPELQANTRVIPGALGSDAIALGGVAVVLDAIFGAGLSTRFSTSPNAVAI